MSGFTVAVVIPCHRQQRHLPRTTEAVERALDGREWQGVVVMASRGGAAVPVAGGRWQVIEPPVAGTLAPGATRMLGLAASGAPWVLFVDADVEVDPAWVAEALDVARREPALAAIWGRVEEWFESDAGVERGSRDMFHVGDRERAVEFVTTPVFYRRAALLEAGGYDPRLRSDEDFELGLRLGRLGLELRSLGRLAGRHWSAPRPSFAELGRRWSSGLCFGAGQALRLYRGRPGFLRLLRRHALYLATIAMWLLGAMALSVALLGGGTAWLGRWAWLPLLVLATLAVRKRSTLLAVHSLASWTLLGAGLLIGLAQAPEGSRAPVETRGARC